RAVVALRGPDAPDWLERLVSTPVKDLPAGCCRSAVLMDGKGKLRADLRLIRPPGEAGEWLLELPASHAAALLRVLDMYVLRDKVELQDRTQSHAFLALLGPRAGAVAAACGLAAPQSCGGDGAVVADGGSGVLIMPSRLYGAPGFDLLLPASAAEALAGRLAAAGAMPVGMQALQLARIEAGVPWFAEDLADGVIPLEAGLDAQVSITKGCYPGQEVVARITNLGQVARRLMRLTFEWSGDEPPLLQPGAPLQGTGERAGQEAGKLTSVAHDESRRRTLALGFVRRAFWGPGTALRAGAVELVVAPVAQVAGAP
ncbi:MAG TPA: hypothetical protein VFD43_07290, partial [Planctomycetota bacterium]|nr:hypothetical protein [Planctomycetota bacterium]